MIASVRDSVSLLSDRVDVLESADLDGFSERIISQIESNSKESKKLAKNLDAWVTQIQKHFENEVDALWNRQVETKSFKSEIKHLSKRISSAELAVEEIAVKKSSKKKTKILDDQEWKLIKQDYQAELKQTVKWMKSMVSQLQEQVAMELHEMDLKVTNIEL